jgi:hypothetical protein
MNKMQAIGAPFLLEHSSCSDLKPKFFSWTKEDCKTKVYIDSGIALGINTEKKPGERKIAWVCESRAIFHLSGIPRDLWDKHLMQIADSYDVLYTSERSLIGKHPNIKFAFAGSNLPWVRDVGVHEKTKNCSLIASPKKYAFGHSLRHYFADKFKDKLDLFGGVAGSKRLGKGAYDGKEEALKDYRFSLVIENDKYETYYTEKITDCFASGTIPVYWGTPDIGNYFNHEGIIELTPDFNLDTLTEELYNNKLDAVRDNFERVQNLLSADDMLYKQINEN